MIAVFTTLAVVLGGKRAKFSQGAIDLSLNTHFFQLSYQLFLRKKRVCGKYSAISKKFGKFSTAAPSFFLKKASGLHSHSICMVMESTVLTFCFYLPLSI